MTLKVGQGIPVPVLAMAAPAAAVPAAGHGVPLYAQRGQMWCWAACAQMMGDAQGRHLGLQQCDLAQKYVQGASGCCGVSPPPTSCDQGALPQTIDSLYTTIDVGFQSDSKTTAPANDSELLALLARGPVEVFWVSLDNSMSHFSLIVGAQQTPTGVLFLANDPFPGPTGSTPGGSRLSATLTNLAPALFSPYGWTWNSYWCQ